MNVLDFAYQIIAMQNDLDTLRSRNDYLEHRLAQYDEAQREQFESNQKMTGKIINLLVGETKGPYVKLRGCK